MNTHQRFSLSVVWATGFIVAWAVASMEAHADILRVDASAAGAADGSTWDHAEGESITVELALTVTVEDDYSFPQAGEYDYGVEPGDIEFSDDDPAPGDTVTITAHVHNNALCRATSAYGWYSSSGRSCWGEWDFDYTEPTRSLVDISYRCRDKDASVHWRVELDGVELASPTVPSTGGGDHWKIVTIHDVPITEGPHTIFLGTYQMDYYPDYEVDWIEIGDVRIEAEDYDRMGGNDPNPDYRGLYVWPMGANPPESRNLTVQIWDGDPSADGMLLFEDFVGETTEVYDQGHDYPGYTYTAHYIENDGVGTVEVDWTPDAPGTYDIYVVVDPNEKLTEIDEGNNVAYQSITVQPSEPCIAWVENFDDGDIGDWTITNPCCPEANPITLGPSTEQYVSPGYGLKVSGPAAGWYCAEATGPEVGIDMEQPFTVEFSFRWGAFHWYKPLLFGPIDILLDYPFMPMRYGIGGASNFLGSQAFQEYCPPNTWTRFRFEVDPATDTYDFYADDAFIGTASYGTHDTGWQRFNFKEHGCNNHVNYMTNAFYDDIAISQCETGVSLSLDIKPGSCPNSFNRNSHGVLPVALAGTDDFDVTQVVISSLRLKLADDLDADGVPPNEGPPGPHSTIGDVATPFEGELCDCHELTGDSIDDLMMHFKTDLLVPALGLDAFDPGALVELCVTGELEDESTFVACDCVRLVPPGAGPVMMSIEANSPEAWIAVSPLDLTLDGGGFADFERAYPEGTLATLTVPVPPGLAADGFVGWKIDGTMQRSEERTIHLLLTGDTTVQAVFRGASAEELPVGPAPSDEVAPLDVEPLPDERPLEGVEYDPSEDARKAVR